VESGEYQRLSRVADEAETTHTLDLLRSRLALFALSFTLLNTTAWIACNAAGVALLERTWSAQLKHPGNLAGALATLPMLAVWLLCRSGRPSRALLDVLDFFGTSAFCFGWALMSYHAPSAAHPGLDVAGALSGNAPIGVFANMAVLYLRASLLPGSPARTLRVSAASCLPIVVVAWLVRSEQPSAISTSFALGTTLLTLWTVPGPAIVSWVIYSLQRQVREARQIGQYTLEAKVGEGGMGVVYRARHALLRRPTAIKLLRPESSGAEARVRFEREVQQTSRLTHANTVAIYDYGHTADGVFYYAMEYLDGISLEELVRIGGPVPVGRVVHILRQVCGALAEAHAAGLIHRDVKPANLHLCVRGGVPDHVKVLDFGLVKQIAADSEAPDLSGTGSLMGTPMYMAPEAIQSGRELDARADLYAVGAVAYFLLAGTPPFSGTTVVEVCAKHLYEVPEPVSKRLGVALPPTLEQLVLQCLEKKPEARVASAAELARALAACAGVAPWCEEDGLRWWREHEAAIAKRSPRTVEARGSPREQNREAWAENTVAVDLYGRA
jgi:hypothetical protein